MSDAVHVDGTLGGGQILRSSLTLSLITGRPLTMGRIREARRRPGLARQHLTAVRAAAEVGVAAVRGDALRSRELRFAPSGVRPGDYRFDIGTAGSATLVLQTVLPALCLASGPSRVVVEGGTHNPLAPPFEFLARSYAPLLERLGPRVKLTLDAYGFNPKGGGRIIAEIQPAERLAPLHLERGEVEWLGAEAVVANLPAHIARRELDVLQRTLALLPGRTRVQQVSGPGPGNVALVEARCTGLTAVFAGFGERGVPAERVASRLSGRVCAWLESGVAAEPYLQDQLLLPLALAGEGSYTTGEPTEHTRSSLEVLAAFLDRVPTIQRDGVAWRVCL